MVARSTADEAMEYASLGWRVIPVWWPVFANGGVSCACGKPSCSIGKHPIGENWQARATTDEATIEQWWSDKPSANVGVQLGPASGIIDVENDSEEGLRFIRELVDDTPTPQFRSGKSVHLIYRWDDALSALPANAKHRGAEFRLGTGDKGQQSVFPPSIHQSGRQYQWIVHPSQCEVATIPERMLAWLANRAWENGAAFERSPTIQRILTDQRIPEGSRNNDLHALACKKWQQAVSLHGSRAFTDPTIESEVWMDVMAWNKTHCQSSLPLDEVQGLFRSAKEFIGRSSAESPQRSKEKSLTAHGLEFRDGEWFPGLWRVTVIEADPPSVLLRTPFSRDGIRLTMDQYLSASDMWRQVANQTAGRVVLNEYPAFWRNVWEGMAGNKKDGKPPRIGLMSRLLHVAEHEDAPFDLKTPAVIADYLLRFISSAKPVGSPLDIRADDFSQPGKTPDGIVWFLVGQATSAIRNSRPDITQRDVSEILKRSGITDRQVKANGSPRRFKIATPAATEALEKLAQIHANG